MRIALCGAICRNIHDRTPDWKAWLAGALDVTPFERMSDESLIVMAHQVLGAEVASAIVAERDATHREIVERFLCPTCQDRRLVEEPDTHLWDRCPRCNPRHEGETL
jgi:ribosomal protein L37AE/L43A